MSRVRSPARLDCPSPPLVYAELFLIGAICLWCTVVHAAVIALFLLAVADATEPPEVASEARASPGNIRGQERLARR